MNPFLDISQLGRHISTNKENEIRFNCVWCEDESFHLYVNTKKKVYHCFKCGAKGKTNVVTDQVEIIHLASARTHELYQPPDVLKLPKAYVDIITPAAARYLASRGIYESDVKWHKIYCAAPNTIYFGRLIIPNNVRQGFCSYFVARSYTKLGWPKYLNPSNPRTTLFLSPERAKDQEKWERYWNDDELMLVEGPFDYLKTARHGPTAALLGKELSYDIAKQIVSIFSTVYIMLDKGLMESIAAIKIYDLLKVHVNVHILNCPKKDPGEMGPEDFRGLF
jgi:DNA primase